MPRPASRRADVNAELIEQDEQRQGVNDDLAYAPDKREQLIIQVGFGAGGNFMGVPGQESVQYPNHSHGGDNNKQGSGDFLNQFGLSGHLRVTGQRQPNTTDD